MYDITDFTNDPGVRPCRIDARFIAFVPKSTDFLRTVVHQRGSRDSAANMKSTLVVGVYGAYQ